MEIKAGASTIEDERIRALVQRLYPGVENGAQVREAVQAEILARVSQNVEARLSEVTSALTTASARADRLARIGTWLNAILAVATAVGTAALVMQLFQRRC